MFSWTRSVLHIGLSGTLVLALSLLLAGCGMGSGSGAITSEANSTGSSVRGMLHGGPNPISGALITLYTTTSNGYGAAATPVTSTTTGSDGSFALPVAGSPCPSGEYAYVTAYGGTTGSQSNPTSLLMVPIGLCSSNYTFTGTVPNGSNTYTGPTLFINEITTAVSAYALGNFMKVTDGGVVNIGAPAANHGTASASSSAPSAAGLAHAFANALAIVNIQTGQPRPYTHQGSSAAGGGVVPVAELELLGNILQSCVNSNGSTGTNSATANDGTSCGKLYSLTTPPQAMTTPLPVPTNTMEAMLDLAKYPNPSVNNWNSTCTATGSDASFVTTATTCLFNLAPGIGVYPGALSAAPPDWALAIVYSTGYGATAGPGNLGLSAPFYVALDYQDNVYVLNYDDYNSSAPVGAKTWSNFVGIENDGTPIFSTVKDTTDLFIRIIATDTAGHVIGPENDTNDKIFVYDTTAGTLTKTISSGQLDPQAIAIDPFSNIYTASSSTSGINLRRIVYTAPTTWTVTTQTTTAPAQQILSMVFDSNLDLYELGYGGTTPNVYMLPNMGTVSSPSLATAPTILTLPSGSSTINAWGIGAISSNNAYVIDSNGLVPITKGTNSATTSGSTVTSTTTVTAGTAVTLPAVCNSTLYSHYLSIDGNDWVFSGDGANNSAASGITVYDTTDNLALGTYKGCAINTGTTVCAGYVINKNNGVAMQDPRNTGIDSSGDIWVPSSGSSNYGSQNLTELIGAAAPSWPGLSMAKSGLPQ